MWTVVSIAEGLEKIAERLRGTVQPHGLEVQDTLKFFQGEFGYDFQQCIHDYTNHLSQLCMYSKHT